MFDFKSLLNYNNIANQDIELDIKQDKQPSEKEIKLEEGFRNYDFNVISACYMHKYGKDEFKKIICNSITKFDYNSFYYNDTNLIYTALAVNTLAENALKQVVHVTETITKLIERVFGKKCFNSFICCESKTIVVYYAMSNRSLRYYDIVHRIEFKIDSIYLLYTDCKYRKPHLEVRILPLINYRL